MSGRFRKKDYKSEWKILLARLYLSTQHPRFWVFEPRTKVRKCSMLQKHQHANRKVPFDSLVQPRWAGGHAPLPEILGAQFEVKNIYVCILVCSRHDR